MARVVYQDIEMVAGFGEVIDSFVNAAPIGEIEPQSGSGMASSAQLSGESFCLVYIPRSKEDVVVQLNELAGNCESEAERTANAGDQGGFGFHS
jgi:hypothetical protein